NRLTVPDVHTGASAVPEKPFANIDAKIFPFVKTTVWGVSAPALTRPDRGSGPRVGPGSGANKPPHRWRYSGAARSSRSPLYSVPVSRTYHGRITGGSQVGHSWRSNASS